MNKNLLEVFIQFSDENKKNRAPLINIKFADKRVLSRRLPASTMIIKAKVFIDAYVVMLLYLIPSKSLIRVPAGQVLLHPAMMRMLHPK